MTQAPGARLPDGLRLRVHQQAAVAALRGRDQAGQARSWVVLPPGAGKTLVGLVEAAEQLHTGTVSHVVVLGPNTAIQGQWLEQAASFGLDVDDDRDLDTPVTVLTYQAVAVFDADDEVADDPEDPAPREAAPPGAGDLVGTLHPNGLALLARMRATDGLLLVLDECHHLLEVWGRLLAEILETIPRARVLGLTATPPEALTAEQAALVQELFGDVAFATSIPAVVKEGDLVPFAELAWLVEPTLSESDWLDSQAVRFAELTTALTDPDFGAVPFLSWLRARFVDPVPQTVTWVELASREPGLCDAALRMHHHGLLELPAGARPGEQHRRPPTVEDWIVLVEDWVRTLDDEEVERAVREALPAVGYVWTRRGVRRGRTPTDRVLARSAAKATATVDIVTAERANLGDRMRTLVLCDHERAAAMVPAALLGVLHQQSGAAIAVLAELLQDPVTGTLRPLLVTGRTVAGGRQTLVALRERVAADSPALAETLEIVPLDMEGDGDGAESGSAYQLQGRWSSRTWVRHVTDFFASGGAQVLVGTRGLLGEGWDARCVTGLVDLTTATSLTAVVQTRGRALRTDPGWPEKVAVTWSVTCVSDRHPKGGNDWDRLVRKHTGFHGVDAEGTVSDGVAHLDSSFSPFAPPSVREFGSLNARMLIRAEDRQAIADAWRVGEPYEDRTAVAVRVRSRGRPLPDGDGPRLLRLTDTGVDGAAAGPVVGPLVRGSLASAALVSSAVALHLLGAPVALVWAVVATAFVPVAVGLGVAGRRTAARVRAQVVEATSAPSLVQVARAVADALQVAGTVGRGADAVEVEVTAGGECRLRLGGVDEEESATFAAALDEVVSPVAAPRYLVSRYVTVPPLSPTWLLPTAAGTARARSSVRPTGELWHAVPSALGTNAKRAQAFADAWHRWVGGGRVLYTGSPEGEGVLAAQAGSDPFEVSTVMRRQWE